jgi:hypothetical protein
MYKSINYIPSPHELSTPGGFRPPPSCSNWLPQLHTPRVWEGPHGSGPPDPDFRVVAPQHLQLPGRPSTGRSKTPGHRSHHSHREISPPPPRTPGHRLGFTAAQDVANSRPNNHRLWAWCGAACPAHTGTIKTLLAFRFQAKLALTRHAQGLTRSSTGSLSAGTPRGSGTLRFSWSPGPWPATRSARPGSRGRW